MAHAGSIARAVRYSAAGPPAARCVWKIVTAASSDSRTEYCSGRICAGLPCHYKIDGVPGKAAGVACEVVCFQVDRTRRTVLVMHRTQNLLPTLTVMEVDVVMFKDRAEGIDHGEKSAAICQANQAAKKPNTPNQAKRPHVPRVRNHFWKCSLSVSSFSLLKTAGISMAKNIAIHRIQPSVHMVTGSRPGRRRRLRGCEMRPGAQPLGARRRHRSCGHSDQEAYPARRPASARPRWRPRLRGAWSETRR